MRTLLALAVLLSAATAAADPADRVRVAVVHEEPLLPSESKALADLQKKLGKRKIGTVDLGDASPAEAAYTGSGEPPAEWKDTVAAVVLHVQPPSGPRTRLVTRGVGTLIVYRGGTAVYSEKVDGTLANSLRGEDLDKWIAGAVALSARAGAGK